MCSVPLACTTRFVFLVVDASRQGCYLNHLPATYCPPAVPPPSRCYGWPPLVLARSLSGLCGCLAGCGGTRSHAIGWRMSAPLVPENVIVIEPGAYRIRIGLALDLTPAEYPPIIAVPRLDRIGGRGPGSGSEADPCTHGQPTGSSRPPPQSRSPSDRLRVFPTWSPRATDLNRLLRWAVCVGLLDHRLLRPTGAAGGHATGQLAGHGRGHGRALKRTGSMHLALSGGEIDGSDTDNDGEGGSRTSGDSSDSYSGSSDGDDSSSGSGVGSNEGESTSGGTSSGSIVSTVASSTPSGISGSDDEGASAASSKRRQGVRRRYHMRSSSASCGSRSSDSDGTATLAGNAGSRAAARCERTVARLLPPLRRVHPDPRLPIAMDPGDPRATLRLLGRPGPEDAPINQAFIPSPGTFFEPDAPWKLYRLPSLLHAGSEDEGGGADRPAPLAGGTTYACTAEQIPQPHTQALHASLITAFLRYALTQRQPMLQAVREEENGISFCAPSLARLTPEELRTYSAVLVVPDLLFQLHPAAAMALLDPWFMSLLSPSELGFARAMVLPTSLAATIRTGRHSACVVDIGHTSTRITCVRQMEVLPASIVRLPSGGRDLTRLLAWLLHATAAPAVLFSGQQPKKPASPSSDTSSGSPTPPPAGSPATGPASSPTTTTTTTQPEPVVPAKTAGPDAAAPSRNFPGTPDSPQAPHTKTPGTQLIDPKLGACSTPAAPAWPFVAAAMNASVPATVAVSPLPAPSPNSNSNPDPAPGPRSGVRTNLTAYPGSTTTAATTSGAATVAAAAATVASTAKPGPVSPALQATAAVGAAMATVPLSSPASVAPGGTSLTSKAAWAARHGMIPLCMGDARLQIYLLDGFKKTYCSPENSLIAYQSPEYRKRASTLLYVPVAPGSGGVSFRAIQRARARRRGSRRDSSLVPGDGPRGTPSSHIRVVNTSSGGSRTRDYDVPLHSGPGSDSKLAQAALWISWAQWVKSQHPPIAPYASDGPAWRFVVNVPGAALVLPVAALLYPHVLRPKGAPVYPHVPPPPGTLAAAIVHDDDGTISVSDDEDLLVDDWQAGLRRVFNRLHRLQQRPKRNRGRRFRHEAATGAALAQARPKLPVAYLTYMDDCFPFLVSRAPTPSLRSPDDRSNSPDPYTTILARANPLGRRVGSGAGWEGRVGGGGRGGRAALPRTARDAAPPHLRPSRRSRLGLRDLSATRAAESQAAGSSLGESPGISVDASGAPVPTSPSLRAPPVPRARVDPPVSYPWISLVDAVHASILACRLGDQPTRTLYGSLLVVGGGGLFQDLALLLSLELSKSAAYWSLHIPLDERIPAGLVPLSRDLAPDTLAWQGGAGLFQVSGMSPAWFSWPQYRYFGWRLLVQKVPGGFYMGRGPRGSSRGGGGLSAGRRAPAAPRRTAPTKVAPGASWAGDGDDRTLPDRRTVASIPYGLIPAHAARLAKIRAKSLNAYLDLHSG